MKIAEYALLIVGIMFVFGWRCSGKTIEVLGSGGIFLVWLSFILQLLTIKHWDELMITVCVVNLAILLSVNHYYLKGRAKRIEARRAAAKTTAA